jgi:cell division protein FtsQ
MSFPLQPIVPSGPRYLRNPGNRRLRKARLTRALLGWGRVVSLHLALVALAVFCVARIAERMRHSSAFTLQRITILGAERVDVDALDSRFEPLLGHNLLDLDLATVQAEIEKDPWVGHVEVKRQLPDELRIRLVERSPRAVAVIDGRAQLIDRQGQVILPTGVATAQELPVLSGLEGLAGEELSAALRRGVRALGELERAEPELAAELSELRLDDRDRLVAHTARPGPPLLLDPRRVARNVNRYLNLRREIEGTLGAVEYVDLRWEGRITVKPSLQKEEETIQ